MTLIDMLLALLARHPASGYGLKKWLDVDGTFLRANADQSQIYRTLRTLERDGLIRHDRVPGPGGPDAKVYEVTASGTARLRELSQQPYRPPARWQEPDFLAWMTLLGPIAPMAAVAAIDRELQTRRRQAALARDRSVTSVDADHTLDFDPDLTAALDRRFHQFQLASLESWVSWLESFRHDWVRLLRDRAMRRTGSDG